MMNRHTRYFGYSKRSPNRFLGCLASLVLAALLWAVPNALHATPESPFQPVTPPVALADGLVMRTETGDAVPLSHFHGKPTLLHFWATWCAPCLEELPELDAFAKAHKDALNVVAVSLDAQGSKAVSPFYTERHITTLAQYFDDKNTLFRAAKVRGLPATLVLNAKGEIVARADRPVKWAEKELRSVVIGE